MLRFSANLGFLWPELPLIERVEAAARAGFKGVEFHWPYETPAGVLKAVCEACSLQLLAINTPPGKPASGDFGLAAVPGREREFAESLALAIAYARDCRARMVHLMAGVVDRHDRRAAHETFVGNIRLAAASAPELTFLLEPINRIDKPGYFYSRLEDAEAVMDEVGCANVRLMFDAYHVGMTEGDVLGNMERLLPRIGHIQVASVPDRAEPDHGSVDFERFFDRLQESGYTGWIGCEYRPRASTSEGLSWMGRTSQRGSRAGGQV
ncbi:MAG TPA: TIM barrel protein [Mesorhizobium sp.]|nr:TIM barrel protein [Mesorhizobium sp.]